MHEDCKFIASKLGNLYFFVELAIVMFNHKTYTSMLALFFKNDIDKGKISVLLDILRSWNIEVELKKMQRKENRKKEPFTLAEGIWKDYDIDANTLRQQAWSRK